MFLRILSKLQNNVMCVPPGLAGFHLSIAAQMFRTPAMENISYKNIVETINDGLYFVDQDRIITYWNRAAERITGFSAEEVVGKSCADDILTHMDGDGNNLCIGACPLAETIRDGEAREAHVYLHHKNGQRVPVAVRVSQLVDEDGQVLGGVELFTDMSNIAANALRVEELERLALLDDLTSLANRNYIEQELEVRFEEKRRNGLEFGLLFMDIDHFKRFNDDHGHAAGDEVLKFVAGTFVANARPFDLYGRWGGEEFVAILRNVSAANLALIATRVCSLVENSYVVHEGQKLAVTLSVGATLARDGDSPAALLERADRLMYQSKQNGRNCVTTG